MSGIFWFTAGILLDFSVPLIAWTNSLSKSSLVCLYPSCQFSLSEEHS